MEGEGANSSTYTLTHRIYVMELDWNATDWTWAGRMAQNAPNSEQRASSVMAA